MTKLSQTCSRTPGYFVFVFPSRLPLGKICHQRQVADSIRFDPILISGNRTEKSLRTHNKRLIVFKNLNINNRQSLICSAENLNRLLAQSGTKSHLLGSKLHSGTSKTKAGQGGLVRVALSCIPTCTTWPSRAKGLFKLSALFEINWHALSQSAFLDFLIYIFMPWTDAAVSKKLKWVTGEVEDKGRKLKLTEVQKD